ncbi:DUF4349 domain-containing protein [Miniphocaeibacter massiliensis]|uniref:DUF4349 domain-containing protein n=1 Tax=Miniphocaeibacter massiliensis TaxID=2041841 RepID=UPI000C1B8351|nr:DUF4349 domain-containing protein [Miniphocaeibacter massiliensis]
MNNKFEDKLKKALTEYEKEIVETAEKNSKNRKVSIISKKRIKYMIGIAAIFILLIPSVFISKGLIRNNDSFYSEDQSNKPMSKEILPNSEQSSPEKPINPEDDLIRNTNTGVLEQKFIENIDMSIETLHFDETVAKLEEIMKNSGGFVESQDIDNKKSSSSFGRTAYYIYRIPIDKTTKFTDELKKLDINVLNSNKTLTNITNDYSNLEKDLDLVNSKIDSLKSILSKATSLSDIIELENKIQEVISEKKELELKLSNLNKDIKYSTVKINLSEIEKNNAKNSTNGFGVRIKEAFENSFSTFIMFIQNIIITLINIFPFLIIAIVISIVILIKLKKRKK